jgi:GST-like protein
LSESSWLGGDAYSIADMAVFPVTAAWKDAPQDFSGLSHMHAWRAKIEARPACARAHDLSKIGNETMGAAKFSRKPPGSGFSRRITRPPLNIARA